MLNLLATDSNRMMSIEVQQGHPEVLSKETISTLMGCTSSRNVLSTSKPKRLQYNPFVFIYMYDIEQTLNARVAKKYLHTFHALTVQMFKAKTWPLLKHVL